MKSFRIVGLLAVLMLAFGISAMAQNVTVNPGAGSYPTLTDAFNAINAGTHTGAITVDIVNSTTEPANTSAVLNSSGAGTASYASVVISPSNDGVTITGAGGNGTACNGRGVIELNGADNVTIDGDNPLTANTNRNLTVTSTCANTYHQVIRIALAVSSTPAGITNTADNNIFRNLNIIGGAAGRNIAGATSTIGTENTTYGIYASSGASTTSPTTAPIAITSTFTTIGSGATANNLTIQNNSIISAARGVAIQGAATTVFPGLLIENNDIGNPTAGAVDQVYSMGVTAQGSTNAIIRGNTVYVESFVASALRGLDVGSISSSASSGFTFERNKVNRVQNNSASGAYGINLAGGSTHTVRNNFVSGVITGTSGFFSTTSGGYGIRISSGTGHFIYYNSVNMVGTPTGTTQTVSTALGLTSSLTTGVDVRNNILANRQSGGNASSAFVSLLLPSSLTSTYNLTINNNAYFSGTTAGKSGIAHVGFTYTATPAGPTTYAGLYTAANFNPADNTNTANLRTYTSILSAAGTNDNASVASTQTPPFTSDSDLHISNGLPAAAALNGTATPIPSVATDIDLEARNATTPDIGADEFSAPTAATATIGGRVSTGRGNGIRNVAVTMTGGGLEQPITVYTGVSGSYQFPGVPVGQTYIISVSARRYRFNQSTRVIGLTEDITDVNFIGEPIGLKGGSTIFGQ